jgi:hypothetical protein
MNDGLGLGSAICRVCQQLLEARLTPLARAVVDCRVHLKFPYARIRGSRHMLTADAEAAVVSRTLAGPAGETTHWTAPAIARLSGNMGWARGERRICSMVRPPSPEEGRCATIDARARSAGDRESPSCELDQGPAVERRAFGILLHMELHSLEAIKRRLKSLEARVAQDCGARPRAHWRRSRRPSWTKRPSRIR